MKKMHITELKSIVGKLNAGEVLLDCRTVEEYSEGHLPGAKNISHDLLPVKMDELKGAKKVYVYCRSGGRAGIASDLLSKAGYDVVHVAGSGFPDWQDAGLPTE